MNAVSILDAESRAILNDGFRRFSEQRREQNDVRDDWKQLAGQGWLALGLPEAFGGFGSGIADLGLMLRAAGEGRWRTPLIECLGEVCGALLAAPASPARDQLLGNIASGEKIVGITHEDPGSGSATVTSDGDRFSITASRLLLPGGGSWTHMLVPVRQRSPAVFSLYLVDCSVAGARRRCCTALDGSVAAETELAGAKAELIAEGPHLLDAARRRGGLLAAEEVLGIVQAAFDASRRHLAERRQFGQPILQFQAIQHRLVDMYLAIRDLAALLEAAEKAYEEQAPHLDELLLKLRAQASLTGRKVTRQSIQLHGGMGMSAEMPIGDYYKRVMQIDSLYGSHEVALDRLAETL